MSAMRPVLYALALFLASSIAHGDARQLGTRPADAWIATLENPTRVAGLKIDEVVSRLRLRPGSVVANIGAGAGAFEGALSAAVAPAGTVYAVDIEQGLLDHIAARAKSLGLSNVRGCWAVHRSCAALAQCGRGANLHVLHHIKDRETY